jgi:hypothetical protein
MIYLIIAMSVVTAWIPQEKIIWAIRDSQLRDDSSSDEAPVLAIH